MGRGPEPRTLSRGPSIVLPSEKLFFLSIHTFADRGGCVVRLWLQFRAILSSPKTSVKGLRRKPVLAATLFTEIPKKRKEPQEAQEKASLFLCFLWFVPF